ncbi:HAD family hydrolase [Gulosibacter macacae]|uniref:HAD family hydrolase n=1 Tax=Gulosibacter macacae TaxID=2488791 RepID=A0A3P3VUH9_9MICO|nr:HAD family hydrolase [Gulosibacter macacae]RRJ85977.1 HAD family hydrolase [Gulosibacter macacae]
MTDNRMLIALDIDGTILDSNGDIPDLTVRQIERLQRAGHEVMLATGRSASDTLPIRERLGIEPRFIVSANGAMTLERDGSAKDGYTPLWVETFNPTETLLRLKGALEGARYAVESPEGVFRYSGRFPDGTFEAQGVEVEFEELLHEEVTRLVVVAPDQTLEDFMARVEGSGLHSVSYSVGWTSWLDIAPDGVNKGTALERVRQELDIAPERVVVAGDGRNDIEMLEWAKAGGGRAVSMGNAPQEVIDAGNELALDFFHDGLGKALATIPGGTPKIGPHSDH